MPYTADKTDSRASWGAALDALENADAALAAADQDGIACALEERRKALEALARLRPDEACSPDAERLASSREAGEMARRRLLVERAAIRAELSRCHDELFRLSRLVHSTGPGPQRVDCSG